jgi:hypothetical protein
VASSTQNQALSALLFLYRDVLGVDIDELDQVPNLGPSPPRTFPLCSA